MSLLRTSLRPASVLAPRLACGIRLMHQNPRANAPPSVTTPHVIPPQSNSPSHEKMECAFVKSLSTPHLMSYALLNFVTSSNLLLSLACKLLPYTPNFLIKSIIYPIYCGGENFVEVRETARRLLDRSIGNIMASWAVEDADGKAGEEVFANSLKMITGSITEVFVKHSEEVAALNARGETPVTPQQGFIAIKPTGLVKDSAATLANYNNPEYAEKWKSYLATCRSICEEAVKNGKGSVVIMFDAEKVWLQDGVYAAQREMMKEFNRDGQIIVAGTVQMYLQNSYKVLANEIELARKGGYQVAMKLVRGAYIHSEPDRFKTIHKTKEDTDVSFNRGVDLMMDHITTQWHTGKLGPVGQLVVASHNIESCERVHLRMAAEMPAGFDTTKDRSVVFGQLMGMNEEQSQSLARRGRHVVKYVPWGPVKETKDYLKRRLEENGDAARGGWEHFVSSMKELCLRALGQSKK